jgi:hypothetical protein
MDMWPATLEEERVQALHAARVALSVVNAALADPGCNHEAGARARLAFRSAAGLMLAASRTPMGVGRRWSKRLITIRDLVEQNAEAGVDLVDGLAALNGESGAEQRRSLLDLLALLSDLVYFLDVLGRGQPSGDLHGRK